MTGARRALAAAVALAVVGMAAWSVGVPQASASPVPGPQDLKVVTAPATAGSVFTLDGVPYRTDQKGEVTIPRVGSLAGLETRLQYSGTDPTPGRSVEFTRFYNVGGAATTRTVVAQFIQTDAVSFSFVDLTGSEVPMDRIERMLLRSSLGVEFAYGPTEVEGTHPLPSVRTVPSPTGLDTKPIYYTVQDVEIDGTNVVNRSQQKFLPSETTSVTVETQFFRVEVDASDSFFGFGAGDTVLVRWPDGEETSYPVRDGRAELPLLPRGEYQMRVDGPGLVTWRPVSVSSDQQVHLELMSVWDIGSLVLGVVVLAGGVLLLGRRRLGGARRSGPRGDPGGSDDDDAEAAAPDHLDGPAPHPDGSRVPIASDAG